MPTSAQFQSNDTYDLVATIAVGQTASNEIDLSGVDPCGLFIPANFDGTTLTVVGSPVAGGTAGAGTSFTVQAGGADYTLTTAPSKYCPVENLAVVAGLRFIKLVAGTAQAGTDTVITLACRPI